MAFPPPAIAAIVGIDAHINGIAARFDIPKTGIREWEHCGGAPPRFCFFEIINVLGFMTERAVPVAHVEEVEFIFENEELRIAQVLMMGNAALSDPGARLVCADDLNVSEF